MFDVKAKETVWVESVTVKKTRTCECVLYTASKSCRGISQNRRSWSKAGVGKLSQEKDTVLPLCPPLKVKAGETCAIYLNCESSSGVRWVIARARAQAQPNLAQRRGSSTLFVDINFVDINNLPSHVCCCQCLV
jgi:hypothetical protein